MRAKVGERGHACALLATEDKDGESQTIAIRGLEELALLKAIGGTEFLDETGADFVELGSDLGACSESDTQQDGPNSIGREYICLPSLARIQVRLCQASS